QPPAGSKVLALSADGKVARSARGPDARLWDTATGRPLGPPLTHRGDVLAAAFSPDGGTVATGGGARAARLWDVAAGTQVGVPLLHVAEVTALAFSPDGRTILTLSSGERGGGDQGSARFWDVATGKPLGPAMTEGVLKGDSLIFSPDGRTVALSDTILG